jgi:hypothetical protein
VSALVSVTWEVTRLFVSVTTWIRGVCQHINTTKKKSGRLLSTLFIQAFSFMQFIHVLDLEIITLLYLARLYFSFYLS